MKTTAGRFARLVVLGHFLILATQLHAKPLKVFILAGQSNMQGHAKVETFDYIGDDPTTAPLLKDMLGADGKPRVLEKVWISSIGCLGDAYSDLTEKTGRLRAGFGAPENKTDLAAPKLPVVLGVLGVDGLKANDHTKAFRKAMAAPAELPEFKGNVVAIETAPFWSEELAAIAEKKEKVSQMAHLLKSRNKKEANAGGSMN